MFDFLRQVPLFAALPREDFARLCTIVHERRLAAGESLFAEGSEGDSAFIIEEGQVEIVKQSQGRDVLLAVRGPGEVIGEIALLHAVPRIAGARARTDARLLSIEKAQLDEVLDSSPSAARALLQTVVARWLSTENLLLQSEKMAQLGTLTAGVAHELNNPAAAVKRSAAQLLAPLAALGEAVSSLARLDPELRDQFRRLERRALDRATTPFSGDSLERADVEEQWAGWLEEQGIEDAWELAPSLVALDAPDELEEFLRASGPASGAALLRWLAATYRLHALAHEIGEGAGRISDIVGALRSYAYLDQGPVQRVDLHEGLDNSLLMLGAKLKGVEVRRQYGDLPLVEAYGSELNQVWTNLIDNAADALDGRGTLVIRTRREGENVVVEIEDDGPGIPQAIQGKVYDPFFTTKPLGKGTGLGLNITYNIVVHRHQGAIALRSAPGSTCFQVTLPLTVGAG